MARRPVKSKPPAMIETQVTIERLGTEGAGLVRQGEGWAALPLTLPGETVRAKLPLGKAGTGLVLDRLTDSPDRIEPACRHFGRCGGCALQHMAAPAYQAFKQGLVRDALARQGLADIPVLPARLSPVGSRRRAILAAERRGQTLLLGFHGRSSHAVIDLDECPVLLPDLAALLAPLRRFLLGLLHASDGATIWLTATETGLDLGLLLGTAPDLAGLEALAEFAAAQHLARLWWRVAGAGATPAAEARQPVIRFGGVPVILPSAGAFLQATAEGEAALIQAVAAGIGRANRVADLFAGCGTFTLSLAAGVGRAVHAVETDALSLAALAAAARQAQLVRVTTERRDLEERPLLQGELAAYDAVVLDPPRAGARAQVQILAASAVPVVVMVSCNPASFARDAAALVAGGYRAGPVLPVDQFLWSPHIELVGVFSRDAVRPS